MTVTPTHLTLTTRDLVLAYDDRPVIQSCSINITLGQTTCLIGPNGCGKSTVLKGLAGLIKPTSGQVQLNHKNLDTWSRKTLAKQLSLLPQNAIAPENISVEQLVNHGRYPHQGLLGKQTQADVDAVEWALDVTSMQHLRDRLFSSLSGGEKQRGWIALALAQQSNILLLDEPTTYLDMGHQQDILALLAQLNQDHKLTIVMVLHDINQASEYADRILAMHSGKIIADGTPENIISTSLVDKLFNLSVEIIQRCHNDKHYPYCLT